MTPRDALQKLVAKLDAIHADPSFQGIWPYLMVHGCEYHGPDSAKELADARAAIDDSPL